MVGDFNEVFSMDWGLGMNTSSLMSVRTRASGTPSYMAPEMLSGNPADVDARTDIYLMGATIHHLLTNQPRHHKASVRETLELVYTSLPYAYPPEIPSIFGEMVNKACAGAKSERFQSMTELREALEDALRHWEAIQITQKQGAITPVLHRRSRRYQCRQHRAVKTILKIRTLLESSIEIWSGNQIAVDALNQLLILMIRHHLKRLELSVAESLFAELSAPPKELGTDSSSLHKQNTKSCPMPMHLPKSTIPTFKSGRKA